MKKRLTKHNSFNIKRNEFIFFNSDDKASVSSQSTDISQTTDASAGTTPPLSAKCSVSISRISDLQNIVSSHKHKTSEKNTVVKMTIIFLLLTYFYIQLNSNHNNIAYVVICTFAIN